MTTFGYSLMCEEHHPSGLVANAHRAEDVGLDFLTISDHIHPWLSATSTRPTRGPCSAVVAQKAATVAAMSGGRFELGLGAGENLNEHVVGRGWPPVHVRHEMLTESIEVITQLLGGGYHSYQGAHPGR